jgi:phage-related protein
VSLIWNIIFFEDDAGRVPVRDYVLTLEAGEQKRLQTRLKILSEKGLAASSPISDKLEDNLYELRLENSPHNPRFLYCAVSGRTLYLLHGFSKTGQANDRVPESEKNIARRRRDELEARLLQAKKNQMQQGRADQKKKRKS